MTFRQSTPFKKISAILVSLCCAWSSSSVAEGLSAVGPSPAVSLASNFETQAVVPFVIQSIHPLAKHDKARVAQSAKALLPSSLALAGRRGFNKLEWPKNPKKVGYTSDELAMLFAGINPAIVSERLESAKRQGVTFFVTHDNGGAFIRRKGNDILINTADESLSADVRLDAFFHDIEGHNWGFVQTLMGWKEYEPQNADIYEAYAMAVGEFRNLGPREQRINAVLAALKSLAVNERSTPNGAEHALSIDIAAESLTAERRADIAKALTRLLTAAEGNEAPAIQSDDAAFQRLKNHVSALTNIYVVPTWTKGDNYWGITHSQTDRSLWWMESAFQWLRAAADGSESPSEYEENVAAVMTAVRTIYAAERTKTPYEAAKDILAQRVRMVPFSGHYDRHANITASLSRFVDASPYSEEIKTRMRNSITRIDPFIENIVRRNPGVKDLSPDTHPTIYVEMALQALFELPEYQPTAMARLEEKASEITKAERIPDEAKTDDYWLKALRGRLLSDAYVINAGAPVAHMMAINASRDPSLRDFNTNQRRLIHAYKTLNEYFNVRKIGKENKNDVTLVEHAYALASYLIEFRESVSAKDIHDVDSLVERFAGRLKKSVHHVRERVHAAIRDTSGPVAIANAIRESVGNPKFNNSLNYLDEKTAEADSEPVEFERIDEFKNALPAVRGQARFDDYVRAVLAHRIDLHEAQFPETGWRSFFKDIDAYNAMSRKIQIYSDVAKQSVSVQEYATGIDRIQDDLAILDGTSERLQPAKTPKESWALARQIVSAYLRRLESLDEWSGAFAEPLTRSGYGKLLMNYKSLFDPTFDVDRFLKVEIPLALKLASAPVTADPGSGLDPREYARTIETSFSRPSITDHSKTPRDRGLDALVAIADNLAVQNRKQFKTTTYDVDYWLYAMNDFDAYQAVNEEIMIVTHRHEASVDKVARDLVAAARMRDGGFSVGGYTLDRARDILEAHLTYLRYQSTTAEHLLPHLMGASTNDDLTRFGFHEEPLASLAKTAADHLEGATTSDQRRQLPMNSARTIVLQGIGRSPSHVSLAQATLRQIVGGLKTGATKRNSLASDEEWRILLRSGPDGDSLVAKAVEGEIEYLGRALKRSTSDDDAFDRLTAVMNAWDTLSSSTDGPVVDEKALLDTFDAILVLLDYSSGPAYNQNAFEFSHVFISIWISKMPALKGRLTALQEQVTAGLDHSALDQIVRIARADVAALKRGDALTTAAEWRARGDAKLRDIVTEVGKPGGPLEQAKKDNFWKERIGDAREFAAVRGDVALLRTSAIRSNGDPEAFVSAAHKVFTALGLLNGPTPSEVTPAHVVDLLGAKLFEMDLKGVLTPTAARSDLVKAITRWGLSAERQRALVDDIDGRWAQAVSLLRAYAARTGSNDQSLTLEQFYSQVRQLIHVIRHGKERTYEQQAHDLFRARVESGLPYADLKEIQGWLSSMKTGESLDTILAEAGYDEATYLTQTAFRNETKSGFESQARDVLNAWNRLVLMDVPPSTNPEHARLDWTEDVLVLFGAAQRADESLWDQLQSFADAWIKRSPELDPVALRKTFDQATLGLKNVTGRATLVRDARATILELRQGESAVSTSDVLKAKGRDTLLKIIDATAGNPALREQAKGPKYWKDGFVDGRQYTQWENAIEVIAKEAARAGESSTNFKKRTTAVVDAVDLLSAPLSERMAQDPTRLAQAKLTMIRYQYYRDEKSAEKAFTDGLLDAGVPDAVVASLKRTINYRFTARGLFLKKFGAAKGIEFKNEGSDWIRYAAETLGLDRPLSQDAIDWLHKKFLELAQKSERKSDTPKQYDINAFYANNSTYALELGSDFDYFHNVYTRSRNDDTGAISREKLENYFSTVNTALSILRLPAPSGDLQDFTMRRVHATIELMAFASYDSIELNPIMKAVKAVSTGEFPIGDTVSGLFDKAKAGYIPEIWGVNVSKFIKNARSRLGLPDQLTLPDSAVPLEHSLKMSLHYTSQESSISKTPAPEATLNLEKAIKYFLGYYFNQDPYFANDPALTFFDSISILQTWGLNALADFTPEGEFGRIRIDVLALKNPTAALLALRHEFVHAQLHRWRQGAPLTDEMRSAEEIAATYKELELLFGNPISFQYEAYLEFLGKSVQFTNSRQYRRLLEDVSVLWNSSPNSNRREQILSRIGLYIFGRDSTASEMSEVTKLLNHLEPPKRLGHHATHTVDLALNMSA